MEVHFGTGFPQGPYTGYTPTVTQSGTVSTFSTNTARYAQHGKLVHCLGRVQVNSAGTVAGANDISITLPVAATSNVGPFGIAYIVDASAALIYTAIVRFLSTTTVNFLSLRSNAAPISTGGAINLGSVDFVAALANADIIDFNFAYEAA